MAALYGETILDHFRNPRNYGSLPDADISFEDFNPLCGDRIRIELRLTGNIIESARFKGDGCAISVAAASILTDLIIQSDVMSGELVSDQAMLAALENDIKQSRVKCALLPLNVLRKGIALYRQRERR